MLRNFERFEEGHYYVYCGVKQDGWNIHMQQVLDRKIYKCIDISNLVTQISSFRSLASFENIEENSYGFWSWDAGFDDWVEVESPDAIAEEGDEVLIIRNNIEGKICPISKFTYFNVGDRTGKIENVMSTPHQYYILKRKPRMDITKDRFEVNVVEVPIGIDQNSVDYFRQYRHIPKYKKVSDV